MPRRLIITAPGRAKKTLTSLFNDNNSALPIFSVFAFPGKVASLFPSTCFVWPIDCLRPFILPYLASVWMAGVAPEENTFTERLF